MDKYQSLGENLFGFEVFEEVLDAIIKRYGVMEDPNFDAGVASAEAAVRRLREDFYNIISVSNANLNHE